MVGEGWAFTVVAPSVSVKDRPLSALLSKFERTDHMLVFDGPSKPSSLCSPSVRWKPALSIMVFGREEMPPNRGARLGRGPCGRIFFSGGVGPGLALGGTAQTVAAYDLCVCVVWSGFSCRMYIDAAALGYEHPLVH